MSCAPAAKACWKSCRPPEFSPAAIGMPPSARTRARPAWSSGGQTGSSSQVRSNVRNCTRPVDRLGHRPGAVDIHHQPRVRTDRLARGADHRHVDFVQLDVAIAARHGTLRGRADQIRRAVAQQAGIGGQVRPRRRRPTAATTAARPLCRRCPTARCRAPTARTDAARCGRTNGMSSTAARAGRQCRAHPGRGPPAQVACRTPSWWRRRRRGRIPRPSLPAPGR